MKTAKILKKVKKAAKQVKESNAAFKKMTADEKRVAIAKDVLAQIRQDKIVCAEGTYFDAPNKRHSDLCNSIRTSEPDTELRDVLKNFPSCQVCARGAIFLSALKVFNNFAVQDIPHWKTRSVAPIDTESVFKVGRRFFTTRQIAAIELAFEGDSDYLSAHEQDFLSDKEKEACELFYNSRQGAENRMVDIMKNIVKNKGKFIP